MSRYRLHFLDALGHVRGAVDWDCADDQAALAIAAGYRIDHGAELWSGDRRVAALDGAADMTADRQAG